MSTPAQLPYAAAHFAMELDGAAKDIGMLKSIEGGNVKTELLKYQNGKEHPTFQQLGKPKVDDIKLSCGSAMSPAFYRWIEEFFTGKGTRKNGSILAGDFTMKVRARRDFYEALITEFAFPKLDGSDKNPVYVNATLAPERVEYKTADSTVLPTVTKQSQQFWAACNFSFTLDGFENACRNVTKVDGFSVKQKPIEYQDGMTRHALKMPGRIEYPNIVFYVPEHDAQPFVDHHIKYAMGGAVQQQTRLKGAIHTHDNAGNDIFYVEFLGADIFSVTHDKSDAGTEDIKHVKVELVVESIKFTYVK